MRTNWKKSKSKNRIKKLRQITYRNGKTTITSDEPDDRILKIITTDLWYRRIYQFVLLFATLAILLFLYSRGMNAISLLNVASQLNLISRHSS